MRSAIVSEATLRLRQDIDFAGRESLGARPAQEDYSLFRSSASGAQLLALLADGMGGHVGGAVASKTAVDAFDETFNAYPAGSVPVKLGAALHQANNNLASGIKNTPSLDGMGCTLVGAYIDAHGLQWISVGDSLLYLYRNRRVTRLNADHSMTPVIEASRRQGKITREEATNHPSRNALRSALTGDSLAMIDAPNAPIPLCKGDVVILASDGLLSLAEDEIAVLISSRPGATADKLAQALIAAVEAKKKPRQDNTSVQIVILPTSLGAASRSWKHVLWWLAGLLVVGISTAGYLNQEWIANLWNSRIGLIEAEKPQEPDVTKPLITPYPVDNGPPSAPRTAPSSPSDEKKGGEASPNNNKDVPSSDSGLKTKKEPLKEKTKPANKTIFKTTDKPPSPKPPSVAPSAGETGKGPADKVEPSGLAAKPNPPAKPEEPKPPESPLPPVSPTPSVPSGKPNADQPASKPETAKPQAPLAPLDPGAIENAKDDKKSK